MKRYSYIILLLLFSCLYCNDVTRDSVVFFKYRSCFEAENSISGSMEMFYNSNSKVQLDLLRVNWIDKDKYNDKKTNFSIMPVLDIGVILINALLFNEDSIMNKYPIQILSNGYYSFKLIGNSDFDDNIEYKSYFFSVFIKNNTDYYVFKKHNWMKLSPGLGLEFQKGMFDLKVGYQKELELIKSSKMNEKDNIFFSIGVNIMYLPGFY